MIEVVRYNMVNDFGTVINPMLVEGQAHGGVVQGIGQALLERDGLRRGRPAADRLVHGLRAAAAVRRAGVRHATATRCRRKTNVLGRQGLRRGRLRRRAAGGDERAGRRAAIGVKHIDMPATPERVWEAMQEAKGS